MYLKEVKKMSKVKIGLILIIGMVFGAIIWATILGVSAASRISANWKEIKFANDKPTIVRAIREQYESAQGKMESEIVKHQQTAEEQLVQEVVDQLKGKK